MTTALTQAIARLLAPATLVTAAAMLVKGYRDAGDGFSAGMIAATGILLQYVALGADEAERLRPVRWAPATAVAGLLLALLTAVVPALAGRPVLAHVPAPGASVPHLGALEAHSALVFDAGVCLLVVGFVVSAIRAIAHSARHGR
jgi:multisubunit Na+/H+ antiporter MnhB subunit